ncbi:MAG: hypothetical protein D6730_00870 [Bacteroidetes bacterium]|nr:MAG: hypothetical protein D6730_00870 [Bacteroidota bacterium]
MSYRILLSDNFKREAKRLAKKYPSFKKDLAALGKQLSEMPTMGISLGNNVYKVRISISSKRKGKSGGARAISYVDVEKETVLLLSIYDKSEKVNISNKEIRELLKKYV